MKSSIKLALTGALVAAGLAPSGALGGAAKTNYDLTVSFNFTWYVPSYAAGVVPVSTLTTRNIIDGLSLTPYTSIATVFTATNAAGMVSNFLAAPPAGWTTVATGSTNLARKLPLFSPTAKMVYRQVLNGDSVASSGFFVVDGYGQNVTNTEVSAWVTNGASVSVGSPGASQTRSLETFAVLQGAPAFILTGLATKNTGQSGGNGATVLNSLNATVGGNGFNIFGLTTVTSVISGAISYSGGHLD